APTNATVLSDWRLFSSRRERFDTIFQNGANFDGNVAPQCELSRRSYSPNHATFCVLPEE
ncbi:MAG TPA: hypothetical protein VIM63_05800, partial [Rhodoferax sp.]